MPIIQAHEITENLQLETDIVIIGSGAGGSVAAAKFARHYRIIMLEEGPFVTRKSFTQAEDNAYLKFYRRQGALATDDQSITILQGKVFGGSTTINWMTSLRTPEHVLNEWVDEHGLSAYSPVKMLPHFKEVETRLSVHQIPETDHNPHNRIILDGGQNLGIHRESSFNNSKNCIGCGFCSSGCAYDAKQDMRLTYLKDALEHESITIYTETKAEDIQYLRKNHQIVKATAQNASQHQLTIETKRVIVAGGAVMTPLLLQKSGLTKSKTLGKFFRIHPVTVAVGQYDRFIDGGYGIPQSAVSFEYANLDEQGYGFWLEVSPLAPLAAGFLLPGFGKERKELLQKFRHNGTIIVLVRDGANKKSSGEIRWRGDKPSIRYRLSTPDKTHLLKGLENACEVHFAAGAKKVYSGHTDLPRISSPSDIPSIRKLPNGPNQISLYSAHPMGTARMGTNPKTSVIDESMEMHQYPGVYIMDGSTLPTAPGVNPMITILSCVTNACKLSDKLEL